MSGNYVANISEGHTDENVKQMVDRCHDGPEVAWVENVDIKWEEAADEFEEFEVVY